MADSPLPIATDVKAALPLGFPIRIRSPCRFQLQKFHAAMSECYEGVVIVGDRESVLSAFAAVPSALSLRLFQLTEDVFGICRVALRAAPFDRSNVEQIASDLSREMSSAALAVFYDNRCGIRASLLYRKGQCERSFGPETELWAPIDEEGRPIRNGPAFHLANLDANLEYDCVESAIALGLNQLGVANQITSTRLQDAFCYDRCDCIAERRP